MKRKFTILLVMCLVISLFAACSDGSKETNPTATVKPTQVSTATTNATPTEVPSPTVPPTPNPYEVDAIITRFDEGAEDMVVGQGVSIETDKNGCYIIVETDGSNNDIQFTIPFDEEVDTSKFQYLAVKYKLGLGASIAGGNHFYAITAAGGPAATPGWWVHKDLVEDGDWHIEIFEFAKDFKEAGSNWQKLRFPGAASTGNKFYVAWMGAFLSKEDVEKFDTDYNFINKGKLEKDERPSDKQEVKLETVDKFSNEKYNFEDSSEGDNLSTLEAWTALLGQNTSKVISVNDNLALSLGFDSIAYQERLASGKPFTLAFDFMSKGEGKNFNGLILNYGDEVNNNNFYENNGMRKDGEGALVGKSGLLVYFKPNKIELVMYIWDNEASKVSFISTEIDVPGFKDSFANMTIVDDGSSTISIKLNGAVIAKVEYANAELLPVSAVAYNERYYRTVKILDAEGKTLAATTDTQYALLSATKTFAFGSRAEQLVLDNIEATNSAS